MITQTPGGVVGARPTDRLPTGQSHNASVGGRVGGGSYIITPSCIFHRALQRRTSTVHCHEDSNRRYA